jgi:hypothetical protein
MQRERVVGSHTTFGWSKSYLGISGRPLETNKVSLMKSSPYPRPHKTFGGQHNNIDPNGWYIEWSSSNEWSSSTMLKQICWNFGNYIFVFGITGICSSVITFGTVPGYGLILSPYKKSGTVTGICSSVITFCTGYDLILSLYKNQVPLPHMLGNRIPPVLLQTQFFQSPLPCRN